MSRSNGGAGQRVADVSDDSYDSCKVDRGVSAPAVANTREGAHWRIHGLLKEWAYAGVTFALAMATISSYVSEGGVTWIMPLLLLALLALSYLMRPPNRRLKRTAP